MDQRWALRPSLLASATIALAPSRRPPRASGDDWPLRARCLSPTLPRRSPYSCDETVRRRLHASAAMELGAPAVPPGQPHRWAPAVGPSCGRRATANLSGLAVCRPPFRAEARTRVARPCDAGFKPTAPHWELGAPRHPSRQRSVTLATVCFPKEAALLLSERGSGAGFPKEAAVLLSERGPIEVGAMPYLRS